MSLRIWLPLTEDLHNQGASDISFTGTNNTIDPNGKIGACTYLSTSAIIRSDQFTPTNIEASICGWIKMTSTDNGCLFGLSAGGATFLLYQLNATSFRLYGQGNYGSKVAHEIDTLEWHHYTLTYDGVHIKLYIDGNYKNQRALEFDLTTTPCYFMIGARDNGSGGYAAHAPAAYYNDIRYYDHCLSPEEVREIANGLVLHYKLDQLMTPNLLLTDPILTIIETGTDNSVYSSEILLNPIIKELGVLQEGTPITVEYDYTVNNLSSETQSTVTLYTQLNRSRLTPAITQTSMRTSSSGHIIETFKVNAAQANYTDTFRIRWRMYHCTTDDSITISNARFYIGTEEEKVVDSSGYGNDTTVENDAIIVSDGGKYNRVLQCDSTHYLTITNNMIIENNAPYAISCWFKSNDRNTSLQIYINGSTYTIRDQSINISGKTTDGRHLASMSTWGGSYHTCDNQWHLCYSSFQNATLEAALDNKIHPAVLNNEENPLVSNYTNIQIGKNFNGQISDLRIYATPLLDSEIKKLYNINMGMDNKNQIHTYEFNELAPPSLSRTGILGGLLNEIDECSHISLQNNTNWLVNGATER